MPEALEEAQRARVEEEEKGYACNIGHEGSDFPYSFHCRLPVFEGPLDLLLHLIRENKIDIYDIPIVDITSQYLDYIKLMKELNLDIAGEFLLMAATLIHIKSRMLLPAEEKEEENTEEDPRAELVKKLLEYQSYKESSSQLRSREEVWKDTFQRFVQDNAAEDMETEPVLFEANVFDLISAFKKLLERAPDHAIEISRETLTVTDRINYIVEQIERKDSIRFEDLFADGFTRLVLVVTFISLLELVRLGLVKLYQERPFGTIWLVNAQQGGVIYPTETAVQALLT